MFYRKIIVAILMTGSAGTFLSGCSSAPKPKSDETPEPVAEIRTQVDALHARIAELEGKLSALNGKLDTLQAAPPTVTATDKTERTSAAPVIPHPADRAGTPVVAARVPSDPDAGFVNDGAVQNYRKALVLLQSKQHSEAVLSFSEFLEHYPDHPLAGSAQYYVGEAYFQQKEYKLALQEFRRVLTSYDRSAHVPEALRKMAIAEESLNLKDDAKAHRQLLTSLYPQSPAASSSESEGIETAPPPGLDSPPLTAPLEQNRENAKH